MATNDGTNDDTNHVVDIAQERQKYPNNKNLVTIHVPIEYPTTDETVLVIVKKQEENHSNNNDVSNNSNINNITSNNNNINMIESSSMIIPSTAILHSIIAGSCSGITSTLVLYPLDVIRTKMQQQASTTTITIQKSQNRMTNQHHYRNNNHGPIHVIRTTIQQGGGIKALYVGITLPLMAQAIYKGTVFTISNITQQSIMNSRNTKTKQLSDQFWGGFVGGAVNGALFVTPVEFVRNQLIAIQAQQHNHNIHNNNTTKSSWDVIRHAARQYTGISTLWRGISWTIYRDSIGCGCFFYTMAYCQHHIHNLHHNDPSISSLSKPSFTTTLISGAMAGLAYWIPALPLDTIKTWVQSSNVVINSTTTSSTNYNHHSESTAGIIKSTTVTKPINQSLMSSHNPSPPPPHPQFSVYNTIHTIYKQHGTIGVIQRLYSGWQVAYSRGIPSAAITMTTYTYVHQYLSSSSSPS